MTKPTTCTQNIQAAPLNDLTLGKNVAYEEYYNPNLLQAVSRNLGRDELGLKSSLPFEGIDIWNGYEFSWLNKRGKPQVALLQCLVPVSSPNLVESKSFKLYLNSFNQTKFDTEDEVLATLTHDLSVCAGETVSVNIQSLQKTGTHEITTLPGECIDHLDIEISRYQPDSNLLKTSNEQVTETLVSHLLKSNCLITGQPDWASILIRYEGNKLNREGLLEYIISFRQHNEFHEQCVERIFSDIQRTCQPEALTVFARYTRRGGLDINPFRSNFEKPYPNLRLIRQ